MSKAAMGAVVQYCGHNGTFIADIFRIGDVNVVHASQPVTMENLRRPALGPTHHLVDFPTAGFWEPSKGVFVVPHEQVRVVRVLSAQGVPSG